MQRRLASTILVLWLPLSAVHAQDTDPRTTADSSAPFAIEDNSFFVEEAFNQEAGVVQTIFGSTFLLAPGWAATVTQEWPVPGIRHQLSVTVPFGRVNEETGAGDVAVNYRYQLLEEGAGRPALSPRITVLMPTGSTRRGLGAGAWGIQTNVPVSKQVRDFYFHGNVGTTWYPSATFTDPSLAPASGGEDGPARALTSPFLAGSAIYRLKPMMHLMLESVVTWQQALVAPGVTDRAAIRVLSPGVRGGWNRGDSQVVVGAAVPVTWGPGDPDAGLFVYASYEAVFWRTRKP
jgi:hypothetical protein